MESLQVVSSPGSGNDDAKLWSEKILDVKDKKTAGTPIKAKFAPILRSIYGGILTLYLISFILYLSSLNFNYDRRCIEYNIYTPFRLVTYLLGTLFVGTSIWEWKLYHRIKEVDFLHPYWIAFFASVAQNTALCAVEGKFNAFPLLFLAIFVVESKAINSSQFKIPLFSIYFMGVLITYIGLLFYEVRCQSISVAVRMLYSIGVSLTSYGVAKQAEFCYLKCKYPEVNFLIDFTVIVDSSLSHFDQQMLVEQNASSNVNAKEQATESKEAFSVRRLTLQWLLPLTYSMLIVYYVISALIYLSTIEVRLSQHCIEANRRSTIRKSMVVAGSIVMVLSVMEWLYHYRLKDLDLIRPYWIMFAICTCQTITINVIEEEGQDPHIFASLFLIVFIIDSKTLTFSVFRFVYPFCWIALLATFFMAAISSIPCKERTLSLEILYSIGPSLTLYGSAKQVLFNIVRLRFPRVSVIKDLERLKEAALRNYRNRRNSAPPIDHKQMTSFGKSTLHNTSSR